jgi:hypothetical protein
MKRKENTRCPRCKKIRKIWLRANAWYHKKNRVSCKNVLGEGKICWICRIREVDPDWRPGMPIPDIINSKKCSDRG